MPAAVGTILRKCGLPDFGGLPGLSREVGAGLVAAIATLTSCFAYAALIFSGPLHRFLAAGIGAALMTCCVSAFIVALKSRFRIAIAAPAASTSAILAVLMVSLAPAMIGLPPDQQLALAYAALFSATAATAAALLLVGFFKAGKFVRFFPYPVLAGFMGATGWLVVAGAVRMVAPLPVSLHSLPQFAHSHRAVLLAALFAWTAALWIATKKLKHPLTLPAALVLASLAADLALHLVGISIKDAQTHGLLFSVSRGDWPGIPALNGEYLLVDWRLLLPLAGTVGAVALIAVLQTLLLATGLELTTRTDVNLDQEASSLGWANFVSAALGGFVGLISLRATTVNRSAGGTTRLTGLVVSLVALIAMLGASSVLAFVPRFVLGGALLLQGLRLMQEWGVATYRSLPRAEWLLVVAIIAITAWQGFITAEVAGLLAACVLFVLSVSRVDVVRAIYGLDARTSTVTWPEAETRYLAEHGSRVQIVQLQGFVFFGSAFQLREKVKAIVGERALAMLILDCSRVIGIDSSAAATMVRISRMLREKNIQQIVVGLSPATMQVLAESGGLDKDVVNLAAIDEALERGERAVLAGASAGAASDHSLIGWLSSIVGGTKQAEILRRHLVPTHYVAGAYLCRQGDSTDELYFIESGRVCALLEPNGSTPTRVRVFGPRTVVGEIAFVLNVPRTAALRVDEDATVWSLDRKSFSELMTTDPDLAMALWQSLVRLQAERLSFATRQIAALI